jgi:hypothetical protein
VSYSALISPVRRLEGGFFIVESLMFRCRACVDQADTLSSNSMDHNQQTLVVRHAYDHERSSFTA